jgi:hypothetical protein
MPYIAVGDLDLHRCVPQIGVGARRGIEGANDDLGVVTRVTVYLLRARDEADALLELVPPRLELLARMGELTVEPVPGERLVHDARLRGELECEELSQRSASPSAGGSSNTSRFPQ